MLGILKERKMKGIVKKIKKYHQNCIAKKKQKDYMKSWDSRKMALQHKNIFENNNILMIINISDLFLSLIGGIMIGVGCSI